MGPLVVAVLLMVAFVGSHVGLALGPVRSRLVARFGEWGFRWLFFAVAAASYTAATAFYADHRGTGGPGLALGATGGPLRALLMATVVVGVTLMAASLAGYRGSPYEVDAGNGVRPPRGLERITRHPFMTGMVLFAGAHALLATHRIGTVLMLALALLAVAGTWHQDRKLRRLRGPQFAGYLGATSAVPFGAVLAGRQRLVARELPFGALAVGLGAAVGLRAVHASIFDHHGLWVVLAVVGGAGTLMLAAWRRSRREAGAVRPLRQAPLPR